MKRSAFALALLTHHMSAAHAHSEASSYWVTVRQLDGISSVPAHLVCRKNQRCDGQMSVSTADGYLRVFVVAMIYGGNAFVRFRGDGRNVACGSWYFARIPLGSRSEKGYDFATLCAAPRPRDPSADPYLGHPVLKTFSLLATVRIDVRARDR